MLKIRFYCGICGKYNVEHRFPCGDKKENRRSQHIVYDKGFICKRCAVKEGFPELALLNH